MTPATTILDQLGLPYRLHSYEPDPGHPSYADEAAEALGVTGDQVLKTLLVSVDGKYLAVCVLRSSTKLDLKAAARAAGGKKAEMARPADAERSTGYVVGGISPLGQRKPLPTFIDEEAQLFDTVFVSGGRRGLEIEIAPDDLAAAAHATFVPLGIN